MPRLSVVGIRLALLYFLLGISFGALLLIHKAMPLHPAMWILLPLHMEFLLYGWVVQLVFSVAYWIFPRFLSEPKRGNPALAWAALGLLNLSILALSAASLGVLPAVQLPARLAQVAAAALLAASLWRRAKPTETGVAYKR
ncbi:MAG: hypothetical protein KIS88_08615 [Anaerolineales bacterium]|nr:hypothetical protein [Anaerolineales bacterium]